jgi:glucose-1-phosphatase
MKAVIWDMGGVLVRTEDQTQRQAWEQKLGLKPGELHDIVFKNEISDKASRGEAAEDEIWKWVQLQLGLTEHALGELRADFFAGDSVDLILLEYIQSLKSDYLTGMITNAWPGIRHWLTEVWKVADAFDSIVVSAEVGLIKPGPAIYELSLDQLGILPKEAVFLDDLIENIHGAQAVGMKAVHFTTREDALKQLTDLL